jgi:glutathione synthase/RimK-type ligase-like ATP-grasp enzyme
MKAESIAGLRSLLDYVSATQTKTILRKFIPHTSQGRLVVVGDKVVASDRATMSITHDFRSNIGDDTTRIWEAHTYTKEIENLAVQAVNACGVEF